MKKLIIMIIVTTGIAAAGWYPSLGASAYFPPDGGVAVYYHGGVGYAFPGGWDTEVGIGYVEWTQDEQNFSIMPVMLTGTYHFLPRRSVLDVYSGLGLGYAWRHMGNAGDDNSPCGQVFAGTTLSVGRVFGIGVSGGYLASDLNHIDDGGFGLGVNLGVGVPF